MNTSGEVRRRAARLSVLALMIAVLCAVGASTAGGKTGHRGPTYKDPRAPIDKRVNDLLGRMTPEEKVGQMAQINLTKLQGDPANDWDRAPLNPQILDVVLNQDKVGSILSGGGASPATNSPQAWAEETNAVQKFALDHSRLGIPIIYGVDAVHGHNNVLGATMFPHQVNLGASFDRNMTQLAALRTTRAVRATGIHWNFAPVVDTQRDLRWGRSYEPFGEDPLLAGELGVRNVIGQEGWGAPGPDRTASTLKHFVGYSAPDNGHDRTNATISPEQMEDIHLPPFAQGIDAEAETVMINSGSVNGVPVHSSRELLTDVLRGRLGFRGVAISDWQDIENLFTKYGIVGSHKEAVAVAINAGVDMSMVPLDSTRFVTALRDNLADGSVSHARVDEAVRRILRLKFRLGLFERPYADPSKANAIVADPADRAIARKSAAESLVLLENDGALPLTRHNARRVLVTGPSADSPANTLGGWSIGWQGLNVPGEIPEVTTVKDGMEQSAPPGTTVDYQSDPAAAVAAAANADAVVVAVGEPPYAETPGDSDTIALPPDHAELVNQLVATGKPVIVVVIAGRPLVMNEQLDGAAASLMAFLPGSEGGAAIADVVFGKTNPSGRLPVSWPKSAAQLPLFYNHPPGKAYDPRYAFGHGLSYTTWDVGRLRVHGKKRGWVQASATIANTGGRSGDDVVLAFAEPTGGGSADQPVRQLVDFERVSVDRRRARGVDLSFDASRLEPGDYRLVVGDESAAFTVR